MLANKEFGLEILYFTSGGLLVFRLVMLVGDFGGKFSYLLYFLEDCLHVGLATLSAFLWRSHSFLGSGKLLGVQ